MLVLYCDTVTYRTSIHDPYTALYSIQISRAIEPLTNHNNKKLEIWSDFKDILLVYRIRWMGSMYKYRL